MSLSRPNHLQRILSMIRVLSASRTGVEIQDLMERYEVTRRTIERDMLALEEAGYKIETLFIPDEPGKVRKRIVSGSGQMSLTITAEEMASVRAGIAALERQTPPSLAATLRILGNRLEEFQSRKVYFDAKALAESQAFVLQAGPKTAASAEVLDALMDAVVWSKVVRLKYRKGGEEPASEYLAEPYGFLWGGRGYLVWRGLSDQKYRHFSLPFIDHVEITDQSYVKDLEFSIEQFAKGAFGVRRDEAFQIVLRVFPEAMTRLRNHTFHPTETIEETPDGGAIVRFTAGGINEICWHLFSWGTHCQPLEPPELVSAFREKIRAVTTAMETEYAERSLP